MKSVTAERWFPFPSRGWDVAVVRLDEDTTRDELERMFKPQTRIDELVRDVLAIESFATERQRAGWTISLAVKGKGP